MKPINYREAKAVEHYWRIILHQIAENKAEWPLRYPIGIRNNVIVCAEAQDRDEIYEAIEAAQIVLSDGPEMSWQRKQTQ